MNTALDEHIADAYAAGFCKAAAEIGVDPAELYKQAGLGQLLGRGRQALGSLKDSASSVLKRYVELLKGGNKLRTMPYAGADKLVSLYNKGEKAVGAGDPASRVLRRVKLYGGALRGDLGNGTAAELRKVLAARAGTAAGAAGVGAGGAAIANND